jgi:hypothetical protein
MTPVQEQDQDPAETAVAMLADLAEAVGVTARRMLGVPDEEDPR